MGIRNESCVAGGNLHLYKEMKSIEKSEYLDKSKKPFHIVILISLKVYNIGKRKKYHKNSRVKMERTNSISAVRFLCCRNGRKSLRGKQ